MNLYISVAVRKPSGELASRYGIPNLLFSFAWAPIFEGWLQFLIANSITTVERVLFDSGAYTVWNSGTSLNVKDYIQYLKKLDLSNHGFEFIPVNLDVIPGRPGHTGSLSESSIQEAAEQSWKHYLVMKASGLNPMPIYHQGEQICWLNKMMDKTDYIGISPANDVSRKARSQWLTKVFKYLDGRGIKTHGFGVTSFTLMESFPWYSVDSASPTIIGNKAGRWLLPISYIGGTFNFMRPWPLDCGWTRLEGAKRRHNLEINTGIHQGHFHKAPAVKLKADAHFKSLSKEALDFVHRYFDYLTTYYKTEYTLEDLYTISDVRSLYNMFFFHQFSLQYETKLESVTKGFFT